MARPKVTKEIDEVETKEISMEEMIAKAVTIAIENSEKKHKAELKKIQNNNSSFSKDDIRIEVMNNTHGVFIIGGKKGKMASIFFRLTDYGDTALLDYEEFRAYYSQSSRVFKSGELIIKEVIGMDLDDFAKRVGMSKLYSGDIKLNDMSTIFKADYEVFEKFIDGNVSLITIVLEHALEAYKKGEFNYGDKQNYFRAKVNDMRLFTK